MNVNNEYWFIKIYIYTSNRITQTIQSYNSDKKSLEKKVDNVDKIITNTSGLVKKTNYNTKIREIENNIPSVTRLVTTTILNTKTAEIENKILDITNLATKAALNKKAVEVESKMKDITNLTTKTALNSKVTETENKIPDTTDFNACPEFNRLTKISFDVGIIKASKSLASKSQVDNALDIVDKNKEKKKKSSNV